MLREAYRYVLGFLFWAVAYVISLFNAPKRQIGYAGLDQDRYTFNGIEYMLPVDIDYPPYPDLLERHRWFMAVECDGVDITELALMYAGPKGNFYRDLGHSVTPDFFDGSIMVFLMYDYTIKTFYRHEPIVVDDLQ